MWIRRSSENLSRRELPLPSSELSQQTYVFLFVLCCRGIRSFIN